MKTFAPELTAQFEVHESGIGIQDGAVGTYVADEDVIGISSDLQQIAFGEFRRNVVIEHLREDGTVATTHTAEELHADIDSPLGTYLTRVAPFAALNVAKRFAEVGSVAGNGFELRPDAIMLMDGPSPVFVELSQLVGCEVVDNQLLVWTTDSDMPSIRVGNHANGLMLESLLPKLIQAEHSIESHSLGLKVGELQCQPTSKQDTKSLHVITTIGLIALGVVFGFAFSGLAPLPVLKAIGCVFVLSICGAAAGVKFLLSRKEERTRIDVHQGGFAVHPPDQKSRQFTWFDVDVDWKSAFADHDQRRVMSKCQSRATAADGGPLFDLMWDTTEENLGTTRFLLGFFAPDNAENLVGLQDASTTAEA